MLAIFAVAAFFVVWLANGLVGLFSGERPRDTGRLWLDVFLRFFAVLDLGIIGRILSCVGLDGLPRKIVLFIGLLCVLVFLVRACHHDRDDQIQSYPVQLHDQ